MEYYFAGSQLFQGWIIGLSLVRDVMNLNYIKYLKYKIDNPSKGELNEYYRQYSQNLSYS